MNTQHINTFLIIVETQSLSKAAEKLFVSQSTISARLNSLEKDLNTVLIKRHPGIKNIELTSKGEEFISIAKKWMSLEKDTNGWINKEPSYKLNIGSIDSINIYVLTPLYRNIINRNNNISVDITTHSSIQVYNLVESNDIDIGLASRFIKNDSLISKPIFKEKMVLISNSYTSNYDDFVHPNDLNFRNQIYHDWGPNFQLWHDNWWNPNEIINTRVDTAGLIQKFIDVPNTWAVVPQTIALAFSNFGTIKISELKIKPEDRVYYKVLNRNPKFSSITAIKIFEEYIRDFIDHHPYLTAL